MLLRTCSMPFEEVQHGVKLCCQKIDSVFPLAPGSTPLAWQSNSISMLG